jgi:putative membrane protein
MRGALHASGSRGAPSVTDARFDVQPSISNHFAWLRTQMGMQRTLMAYVRTAVSLVGFGFTVAQFFQRLQGNVKGLENIRPDVPRNLGLILIGAGVISLVIATVQYHRTSTYLRSGPLASIAMIDGKPMHTSAYFSAVVVILIGIAAFGSVFVKF